MLRERAELGSSQKAAWALGFERPRDAFDSPQAKLGERTLCDLATTTADEASESEKRDCAWGWDDACTSEDGSSSG